ncbi:MAG TPA: hypothetical protein DD381_06405 [Lentisphaeria bacterium]|nr:MAG: hypothetical protein A2X47_13375 [Lentisphaerae bacterium GWF2_38_69]HBM15957.1 hypothetical protein [Lentisphaeria bacterium]
MQKKILMTGITGLVGSAYAVKLLKKNDNIQIVALTRGGKGNKSAKEKVAEAIKEQCTFDAIPGFAYKALKRIDVIDRDVSSTIKDTAIEKLTEIDSIFHCAANVNLGKDPYNNVYIGNYTGAKNMIDLAKKFNVDSYHHVSTSYVAGRTSGLVKEDGLVPNTTFNNSYEKSKYNAEMLVRSSGLNYSIYRPAIIVGRLKDGKIRKPLAFYRILEFFGMLKKQYCAKTGTMPDEPMDIPHLRMETRTSDKIYFVPIDYVADTIYDLSLLPCENKTFHITGKGPAKMVDIVTATCKILKIRNGISCHEKVDKPTLRERMISKFLGDLLPYFASDITFDVSNVVEALGEKNLHWKMDEGRLLTIVKEFYLNAFPEMIS